MSLIKSISGIRGTIGGKAGDGLNPLDIVKFTAAYATFIRKNTPFVLLFVGMEELNELLCGMDNAQFLELLIADQVAEGTQTDLRILQQLIGHQHLLVGVQFGRDVYKRQLLGMGQNVGQPPDPHRDPHEEMCGKV